MDIRLVDWLLGLIPPPLAGFSGIEVTRWEIEWRSVVDNCWIKCGCVTINQYLVGQQLHFLFNLFPSTSFSSFFFPARSASFFFFFLYVIASFDVAFTCYLFLLCWCNSSLSAFWALPLCRLDFRCIELFTLLLFLLYFNILTGSSSRSISITWLIFGRLLHLTRTFLAASSLYHRMADHFSFFSFSGCLSFENHPIQVCLRNFTSSCNWFFVNEMNEWIHKEIQFPAALKVTLNNLMPILSYVQRIATELANDFCNSCRMIALEDFSVY